MTEDEWNLIDRAFRVTAAKGLFRATDSRMPAGFDGTYLIILGRENCADFQEWFERQRPKSSWLGSDCWWTTISLPHRWCCYWSQDEPPAYGLTLVTREPGFLSAIYEYPYIHGMPVKKSERYKLMFGSLSAEEREMLSKREPALRDEQTQEQFLSAQILDKVMRTAEHLFTTCGPENRKDALEAMRERKARGLE